MGLSLSERETIINFNPKDDTASIFTTEPRVWAKVERLRGFKLVRTDKLGGEVVGKKFLFPRAYVRFNKGGIRIGPPREVSQAQRERSRENMKKIRSRATT